MRGFRQSDEKRYDYANFGSAERAPPRWEGAATRRVRAGPTPNRVASKQGRTGRQFLGRFAPRPRTHSGMPKAVEKVRPSIVEARTPDGPVGLATVGTVT